MTKSKNNYFCLNNVQIQRLTFFRHFAYCAVKYAQLNLADINAESNV